MRIHLTSMYVDDQDRALAFYTEILGFELQEDFRVGAYRWLTLTARGTRMGHSSCSSPTPTRRSARSRPR